MKKKVKIYSDTLTGAKSLSKREITAYVNYYNQTHPNLPLNEVNPEVEQTFVDVEL